MHITIHTDTQIKKKVPLEGHYGGNLACNRKDDEYDRKILPCSGLSINTINKCYSLGDNSDGG